MSYVMSDALQSAVFTALSADTILTDMLSGAIFDALPPGTVPALYVMLGPERVRDRSDGTASAALHDFAVTASTDGAGYLAAKQAATRVCDLLSGADLALARGRLVRLDFLKAQARQKNDRREVECWFRAFVEDITPV